MHKSQLKLGIHVKNYGNKKNYIKMTATLTEEGSASAWLESTALIYSLPQ